MTDHFSPKRALRGLPVGTGAGQGSRWTEGLASPALFARCSAVTLAWTTATEAGTVRRPLAGDHA